MSRTTLVLTAASLAAVGRPADAIGFADIPVTRTPLTLKYALTFTDRGFYKDAQTLADMVQSQGQLDPKGLFKWSVNATFSCNQDSFCLTLADKSGDVLHYLAEKRYFIESFPRANIVHVYPRQKEPWHTVPFFMPFDFQADRFYGDPKKHLTQRKYKPGTRLIPLVVVVDRGHDGYAPTVLKQIDRTTMSISVGPLKVPLFEGSFEKLKTFCGVPVPGLIHLTVKMQKITPSGLIGEARLQTDWVLKDESSASPSIPTLASLLKPGTHVQYLLDGAIYTTTFNPAKGSLEDQIGKQKTIWDAVKKTRRRTFQRAHHARMFGPLNG